MRVIFRFDRESSNWVGLCPGLGIYSQGATLGEASVALEETAKLYIATKEKLATQSWEKYAAG
jgi:predicted RNase H-like HicB family nuclease